MELSRELFVPDTASTESREAISRPSLTYWQDAWRRFKQNKVAIAALIVLCIMVLISIVAPMVSPYKYTDMFFDRMSKPPTWSGPHIHYFGTDDLGRDLWTRVWYGGRISLFIGFAAALLDLVIGALYGGIAGYLGGRVDDIMMRIVEVIYGLPTLMVLVLLMLIFPPGLVTIILVMALLGWVGMARLVRGQVLQMKEQEFVLAARTLGASPLRIIIKHLLPNAMGPILVSLTLGVPGAIFFEASLSFLGLGVKIPIASWGSLANTGRQWMLLYPHMLLFPAIFIAVTMFCFNIFGDGLRDALDPRLRGRD